MAKQNPFYFMALLLLISWGPVGVAGAKASGPAPDPVAGLSVCPDELAEKAKIRRNRKYAFVGVNLISMTSSEVVPDQTVITAGDEIVWIGDTADARFLPGARIIYAQGQYLIPGLADMHIHLAARDILPLYVAHGITRVRNMWGEPAHLLVKAEADAGKILGPRIVTAGPIIDGDPPVWSGSRVLASAGEAEALVVEQKNAGYDFLKVYDNLAADVYDALVAAAVKHDMSVAGHVPYAVGLDNVLTSPQRSIEHLADFPSTLGAPGQSWDQIDHAKIEPLAEQIAAVPGLWNVPTMGVVRSTFSRPEAIDAFLDNPELKYSCKATYNPPWLADHIAWLRSQDNAFFDSIDSIMENIKTVTLALHEAGAPLVAGTDVGNPFLMPGTSLHDELDLFVDAGLTPYEALRTATVMAAELLGDTDSYGTIEVGKKADLVLLDYNPLADIKNLRDNDGVMLRGQWFGQRNLERRLNRLARFYRHDSKRKGKPENKYRRRHKHEHDRDDGDDN